MAKKFWNTTGKEKRLWNPDKKVGLKDKKSTSGVKSKSKDIGRTNAGAVSDSRSRRALSGAKNAANRLIGLGGEYAARGRKFEGIDDQIIDQASQSPDFLVDQAATDTTLAFDKSKGIMDRNASRMGIDPSSGRFGGLQQQWAMARSAAEAGAKTRARRQATDVNFSRLLQASGIGSRYPGLAVNATSAGGSALSGLAGDYGSRAFDSAAEGSYVDSNSNAGNGGNGGNGGSSLQSEVDQEQGDL